MFDKFLFQPNQDDLITPPTSPASSEAQKILHSLAQFSVTDRVLACFQLKN